MKSPKGFAKAGSDDSTSSATSDAPRIGCANRKALVLGAGTQSNQLALAFLYTHYYRAVYINDFESCDEACVKRQYTSLCKNDENPDGQGFDSLIRLNLCDIVSELPTNLHAEFMGMHAEQIPFGKPDDPFSGEPYDIFIVAPDPRFSTFPVVPLIPALFFAAPGTNVMISVDSTDRFLKEFGPGVSGLEYLERIWNALRAQFSVRGETFGPSGRDVGLLALRNNRSEFLRLWFQTLPSGNSVPLASLHFGSIHAHEDLYGEPKVGPVVLTFQKVK